MIILFLFPVSPRVEYFDFSLKLAWKRGEIKKSAYVITHFKVNLDVICVLLSHIPWTNFFFSFIYAHIEPQNCWIDNKYQVWFSSR